jgi:hypothetical protein
MSVVLRLCLGRRNNIDQGVLTATSKRGEEKGGLSLARAGLSNYLYRLYCTSVYDN